MSRQTHRTEMEGRIDRSAPLAFTFNGVGYEGYRGDSLASALLANGVRLVGRSFKYHRLRGIFGAGAEEPNALVCVGEGARAEPNLKATQVELYDGLAAHSQNHWPSLEFDLYAANDVASRLLPAGFYYKTFMWPGSWWRFYEHFIRKAAGLGRAPVEPDPDHYDRRYVFCDVLVVGAGPAGLMAATTAARSGARVIVTDDAPALGGSLLACASSVDGGEAIEFVSRICEELASSPNVRVLTRTNAFGYYDDNMVAAVERRTRPRSGAGCPPPAPAGVVDSREGGGAGDRRHRAAARVRGERSIRGHSCLRPRERTRSSMASGSDAARWCSPTTIRRTRRSSRYGMPVRRSSRWWTPATEVPEAIRPVLRSVLESSSFRKVS